MGFVSRVFAGLTRPVQAVSDFVDWLAVDQMFGRVSSIVMIYFRPAHVDGPARDEQSRGPNLD